MYAYPCSKTSQKLRKQYSYFSEILSPIPGDKKNIHKSGHRDPEIVLFLKILFFCTALLFQPKLAVAQAGAICAIVKIEIEQELTFERQAFDARLRIDNGLDTTSIENLNVDVLFTDDQGNGVIASSDPNNSNALFFIGIPETEGVESIDGTGTIGPGSSAEVHWLIIPTKEAASGVPSGKLYFVGARISYLVAGEEQTVEVSPDSITVKPLPSLKLDYFLPLNVYGDDPFTDLVEPVIPFSLGVRVKNNDVGVASELKIDSAQPEIVENEQGLLIDFTLTGSTVNDDPVENTLLVDFGDLSGGESKVARWIMETSLSGRFTEFDAEFSHSDELGGQLTSILESPETHTLIQDVIVDLPGRDNVRDFLALDGDVYRVYESNGNDTTVNDHSLVANFTDVGSTGEFIDYSVQFPQTVGFSYLELSDPFGGEKVITQVSREDGKILPVSNAWLSQKRNNQDNWEYYFNLFDANSSGKYLVRFGPKSAINSPPVLEVAQLVSSFIGQQVTLSVNATDSDNSFPTINVVNLPDGAEFTDNEDGTGLLSWAPDQPGDYVVRFTASDGVATVSASSVITVSSFTDSDSDGIDDAWEIENFGDTDRDGSDDFDGDGISDLEEFKAGFDPTLPTGPRVPGIASPRFNDTTNSEKILLSAVNAFNPADVPLTYEFEVFDLENLAAPIAGTKGVLEGSGRTEWLVDAPLDEDSEYIWRVRSNDGYLSSAWDYGAFNVNRSNNPPSIPVNNWPPNRSFVDSTEPNLSVVNVLDPEGDPVVFSYRLANDSSMQEIIAEAEVNQGAEAIVKWKVPEGTVTDGGTYYWQVVTKEGSGESVETDVFDFTVASTLTPISAPVVLSPTLGEQVPNSVITLQVETESSVANSYIQFEIDESPEFNSLNILKSSQIGIENPEWQPPELFRGEEYFWRARVFNSGNSIASEWVYSSFSVSTDDDTIIDPWIVNPSDGSWVDSLSPVFTISQLQNSGSRTGLFDVDLYTDVNGEGLIESLIGESSPISTVSQLSDNSFVYWRAASSVDTGARGSYTELQKLYVNDNGYDDVPAMALIGTQQSVVVGDEIRLFWSDDDPDSSATIALYVDNDSEGFDGELIAANIAEDLEGSEDSYYWDTTGMSPGLWFVYGVISDDENTTSVYQTEAITLNAVQTVDDPIVISPANILVEATDIRTPVDLSEATATDSEGNTLTAIASELGPFPIGITQVVWTATDDGGRTGTVIQLVEVVDTTPPVFEPLIDISDVSPNGEPIEVNLGSASASDIFGPVIISNDAPEIFSPGVTTVTWIAKDENENIATASQLVEVIFENNPIGPLALADTVTLNEDTEVTIDVAGNDTWRGEIQLEITVSPNGRVVVSGSTIQYVPNPDEFGTDNFRYSITDSSGLSASADVLVTVVAVNDDPLARPDTASTTQGEAIDVIDVLANDFDIEDDQLSVELVTAPNHGRIKLNGSTFNYIPDTGFSGDDRFTYRVLDSGGKSDTALVTITVLPSTVDQPLAFGSSILPYYYDAPGDVLSVLYDLRNNSEAELTNVRVDDELFGGTICDIGPLWGSVQTSCLGLYSVTDDDISSGIVESSALAYADQLATPVSAYSTSLYEPGVVEDDLEIDRILVTEDKAPFGNGPGDGWILFNTGQKQWISATCRQRAESNGFEVEVLTWLQIDTYASLSPALTCDDLPGVGDTVINGTVKTVLITDDKAPIGDGASDGWVLFADNRLQWVDSECRTRLETSGLPLQVEQWSIINSYARTTGVISCPSVDDSDAPTFEGIVVTEDKLTGNGGSLDGWVYFSDGTKQWVTQSCREKLEDGGSSVTVSEWSQIDSLPASLTKYTCTQIQAL